MKNRQIDFKKDGSASKLRSHGGNVPVLPQTKHCPHCPAKFTRTTHLNRHLRTHSTSRDYVCNKCGVGFTRSDLLSRHARSCDLSQYERRTRRKSCEACSQSKVKCDLDVPCGKCRERGRQCVYPTGLPPALDESGPRSLAGQNGDAVRNSPDNDSESLSVASLSADYSYPNTTDLLCSSSSYRNGASSLSILTSSSVDHSLASVYQSDMYESLFSPIFSNAASGTLAPSLIPTPPPGHVPTMDQVPIDFVPLTQAFYEPQIQAFEWTNDNEQCLLPLSDAKVHNENETVLSSLPISSNVATLRELHWYQYLYETLFVKQTHTLHPTFDRQNIPDIFKRAMEAGGAMLANNERAKRFINAVFVNARTELPAVYAQDHTDVTRRIYSLRATALLQTMSFFESEHRSHSILWFQLMVDMIRQTRTIEELASWRPVCLSSATLDTAWREWAEHEHLKRLLWMVSARDACNVELLGHEPALPISMLTCCLPCEELLWNAGSSAEWLELLNEPSPYGTVEERLLGVPFPSVWAAIISPSPALRHTPLGPLAHFHLIQLVLVHLFVSCRPTADKDAVVNAVQWALHNWLQSFLASPEVPVAEPGQPDPPFFHNSLPFYWFGQVALTAYQYGVPPFSSGSPDVDAGKDGSGEMFGDKRLELVKRWQLHIRAFLKRQDQSATVLWDELMRIRLDGTKTEKQGRAESKAGEDKGKEGLISYLVAE